MKKTTLALLLAAVAAMPAMAQDKSGFALTAGMIKYTGDFGDALEKEGAETAFLLGADYTFSGGFILGATSTAMNEIVDDVKIGEGSFFGGYELDSGVRLKAGVGFTVLDTPRSTDSEAGLMLGLGYVFDNGIIVEGGYTSIEVEDENDGSKSDANYMSLAVGYKF